MSNTAIRERINKLRNKMTAEGIDVCLMTSSDSHCSEYVADYFKVTEYFSGCTSDNVVLVVNKEKAWLWTDGRYFISAAAELKDTGIGLMRMGDPGVPTVSAFLDGILEKGMVLGYDGTTVRAKQGSMFRQVAAVKGAAIRGDFLPADDIWTDRPSLPSNPVWFLQEEESGEAVSSKIARVREKLKSLGAGAYVITKLDDIMWLANIRGADIPFNPVALCYAFITADTFILYIQESETDEKLVSYAAAEGISLKSYDVFYPDLENTELPERPLIDPDFCPDRIMEILSKRGIRPVIAPGPVGAFKAVKNPVERDRIRECYRKDSVELCRFLAYVSDHVGKEEMTECSLARKLNDMRSTIPDYLDLSFATISAYGPNGAIVHYEPKEERCAKVEARGFLLVDSGGQYRSGTTDVTRTVSLGEISEQMRRDFTYVAIANLRLMNARFPYGSTGQNLDVFARGILWENGLDFNHGTGHGIGNVLNVHEGPQNISWRIRQGAAGAVFEPGMITSDEPGIYREGEYGIRTETILECVESGSNEFGRFLAFRPLTLVPIDLNSLDVSLMDESDIRKLNAYHKEVYEKIAPDLKNPEQLSWLTNATREVTKAD